MEDAIQLPKYKCHKEVRAAKIDRIERKEVGYELHLLIDTHAAVEMVTEGWADKHAPRVGGYLVVYADGYRSFSPAEAFEDGYSRVATGTPRAPTAPKAEQKA